MELRKRAIAVVAAIAGICAQGVAAQDRGTTLFAYVGTGIKEPVIELAELYKARTGVSIEMTFNNSGSLVGQLSLSKTGDLFMPGSQPFVEKAKQLGLVAAVSGPMGYHVPVIVVPNENPAKIRSIADFARPGVSLVLPDKDATALGKSIFKVFDRLGITAAAEANVTAFLETPQKVVAALSLGQGDAGIVDYSNVAKKLSQFTVIPIDPKVNAVEVLPCAVLSCSIHSDAAMAFLRFAEKEGPAIFAKHGFKTSL